MAKQTLILPQQKTFYFSDKSISEIDKEVNVWLKETVLKGHHPSPSGPSVSTDANGGTTIIYMFATTIEK